MQSIITAVFIKIVPQYFSHIFTQLSFKTTNEVGTQRLLPVITGYYWKICNYIKSTETEWCLAIVTPCNSFFLFEQFSTNSRFNSSTNQSKNRDTIKWKKTRDSVIGPPTNSERQRSRPVPFFFTSLQNFYLSPGALITPFSSSLALSFFLPPRFLVYLPSDVYFVAKFSIQF